MLGHDQAGSVRQRRDRSEQAGGELPLSGGCLQELRYPTDREEGRGRTCGHGPGNGYIHGRRPLRPLCLQPGKECNGEEQQR